MKNKFWAIVAVLITFGALFFAFQALFSKQSRVPASTDDFNSMIEQSQGSQKQLIQELEKAHPPEKLNREGLIDRQAQMKREVIDGTGETVVSRDSKPFFKDPKRKQFDDKKNIERLSREVDSER